MPAPNFLEYDASDIDARVNAGVAVLALTTNQGLVAVSMTPEIFERLALRIQLELARQPDAPTPAAAPPEPRRETAASVEESPIPSMSFEEVAALRKELTGAEPKEIPVGRPVRRIERPLAPRAAPPRGETTRFPRTPPREEASPYDDPMLPFATLPYDDSLVAEEAELVVPYDIPGTSRRERVVSFEDSPAGRLAARGVASPDPRTR